jgi:SAM-dependent methyltransferase
MNCRFDGKPLTEVMVELGHCPPSNSYVTKDKLLSPEVTYPLTVYVSEGTFYAQVPEFKRAAEIFNEDYAYFSSVSTSWLAHCEEYVNMMIKRFGFNRDSFVVEIASNDGYLLQYFKQAGVPCLGVEPSLSVAKVAREKGIETEVDFFGERSATGIAEKRKKANLILGNNVFAHVPDVNDFIKGVKALLADKGVVTFEFPHLLQLLQQNQFDTIYHEHYSYFSLFTVQILVAAQGLEVFDVEEIPTHGGSLRVFLKHKGDVAHPVKNRVKALLDKETTAGINNMQTYRDFAKKAEKVKIDFLKFLIAQKEAGKKVAAYGAAAKGNTLMNYCGVKPDLLPFVVDASEFKQGRYMPGSHIPIVTEDRIKSEKPDYIVILPWNIKDEVTKQLSYVNEWGAKFVVAIPELTILS